MRGLLPERAHVHVFIQLGKMNMLSEWITRACVRAQLDRKKEKRERDRKQRGRARILILCVSLICRDDQQLWRLEGARRGAARRGVGPPASRSRCCPIDPPQHARRDACVDGWRVAGGKNGQQIQALKQKKVLQRLRLKFIYWGFLAGKCVKADLTHDLASQYSV